MNTRAVCVCRYLRHCKYVLRYLFICVFKFLYLLTNEIYIYIYIYIYNKTVAHTGICMNVR